ncbi:hypothetical protein SERLA73DRAFT_191705 [Serpula lacrymans var. lacrymans S7.3]|uniref:Uncharacterized protein n=2 Tax=Serpula lacrymans var. lacrymans TaxID=341189 RepID=F8QI46_SERL3|nr:uncharacterized protein SERLADRAFT_396754 [Serpula lacrymans var. lacrymans S7.9]EGN92011.1 hypothetical protein SERLA73DRAFT_191705 [Serpula lacrymans var. lacrymans S7.3]EGO21640.1 hypothetical protein SERLADRAFT_396754 [Serpula lacrymans var. lacrymans S7.9]
MELESIFRHNHGSEIYVVRAFYNGNDASLVAIGGEHSVQVLHLTASSLQTIAWFYIGSRITAIAWSPKTVSPNSSDEWTLELTAASADFGLHALTKSFTSDETAFPFGGGLSGHHGTVNDMCFCGGREQDSARYVATVSDDKMLMVWDLHPTLNISSSSSSPDVSSAWSQPPRPQPTAYVISFPHPLMTVSSHPSTSKEFLVSDCRGSIFLIDWRSDPEQRRQGSWRHLSSIELIEPRSLSNSATGLSSQWTGCSSWRRDDADIFGATYGSNMSIWNLPSIQGGRPSLSGTSFREEIHRFRWCPTNPSCFAVAARSSGKGAVIFVHNSNYVHAHPLVINVASRPNTVRDFDFLTFPGQVLLSVAMGAELLVYPVQTE